MASNRIGRINDDIQRVLSDRLRSVKDPRVSGQGMITVTRVETTGDLRYAKVWLSVFGLQDEKEFKKSNNVSETDLTDPNGFKRKGEELLKNDE